MVETRSGALRFRLFTVKEGLLPLNRPGEVHAGVVGVFLLVKGGERFRAFWWFRRFWSAGLGVEGYDEKTDWDKAGGMIFLEVEIVHRWYHFY